MHKVIIAGSRDITNRTMIRDGMNAAWEEFGPYEVISGMARGVDSIAASIAANVDIKVYEMPADWDRFGKSAGYKRNESMAQLATHLIAFWDGESKGTKHMIDLGHKYDLKVTIIRSHKKG